MLAVLACVALLPMVRAATVSNAALAYSSDGAAGGAPSLALDEAPDATAHTARPDSPGKATSGKAESAAPAANAHAPSEAPPAPSSPSANTRTAGDVDLVRGTYKDVVTATGAQETYQQLNADLGLDKAHAQLDAGDDDAAAVRKARANAETGRMDRTGAGEPPRTAEQLRQDEARASMLTSQLIDEVLPWVAGAAVLYVGLHVARYLLVRSRAKAARRRRHRSAVARSR